MAEQKLSNTAICPECDGPVRLNRKLHIGQRLLCHRCGANLVITDRKPLELDLENGKRIGKDRAKAQEQQTKNKSHALSSNEQTHYQKEEPLMSTISKVSLADCPECTTVLRFHKPLRVGQLVVCHDCNETLEVVSLRPLKLHWADEAPWDYEDRDDPRYNSYF